MAVHNAAVADQPTQSNTLKEKTVASGQKENQATKGGYLFPNHYTYLASNDHKDPSIHDLNAYIYILYIYYIYLFNRHGLLLYIYI